MKDLVGGPLLVGGLGPGPPGPPLNPALAHHCMLLPILDIQK